MVPITIYASGIFMMIVAIPQLLAYRAMGDDDSKTDDELQSNAQDVVSHGNQSPPRPPHPTEPHHLSTTYYCIPQTLAPQRRRVSTHPSFIAPIPTPIPIRPSQASNQLSVMGFASSIPGVLVAGTAGAIADQLGRKTAIIIPMVGSFLQGMVVCAAAVFDDLPLLAMCTAAYFINGCTGQIYTFLTGIFSSLGDLTSAATPETRAHRAGTFALNYAFFMAGVVIGPLTGGIISTYYGYAMTMFVGSIMVAVALLWVLLVTPETLPPKSRGTPRKVWWKTNSIQLFYRICRNPNFTHDPIMSDDDKKEEEEEEEAVSMAKVPTAYCTFEMVAAP